MVKPRDEVIKALLNQKMRERFILSEFFFTLTYPLVTGTGAITAFFSKKKQVFY
jgi:hypothetical protein